ncbi:hypothetical protein BpHYR1_007403 [Brachionus plicatilis]|uniref:Secreted protein n=1 Tax=Brachionus plicatilis TaxID=10195 RepID=A0A3M7PM33_BRAPC|nr:hypothetical protein BpHYR1_007403 [Brachionus plicatilis]
MSHLCILIFFSYLLSLYSPSFTFNKRIYHVIVLAVNLKKTFAPTSYIKVTIEPKAKSSYNCISKLSNLSKILYSQLSILYEQTILAS